MKDVLRFIGHWDNGDTIEDGEYRKQTCKILFMFQFLSDTPRPNFNTKPIGTHVMRVIIEGQVNMLIDNFDEFYESYLEIINPLHELIEDTGGFIYLPENLFKPGYVLHCETDTPISNTVLRVFEKKEKGNSLQLHLQVQQDDPLAPLTIAFHQLINSPEEPYTEPGNYFSRMQIFVNV